MAELQRDASQSLDEIAWCCHGSVAKSARGIHLVKPAWELEPMSRPTPPSTTKNWPAYNDALKQNRAPARSPICSGSRMPTRANADRWSRAVAFGRRPERAEAVGDGESAGEGVVRLDHELGGAGVVRLAGDADGDVP